MGKHTLDGTTIEIQNEDLTCTIEELIDSAHSFYAIEAVVLEHDDEFVKFGLLGRTENLEGFLADYYTGDRETARFHMTHFKLFLV